MALALASTPPTELQSNIKNTILLADNIREELDEPVRCLSGYRPPLYNDCIGGAESSMHMFFRALDLQPVDLKLYEEFEDICESIINTYRDNSIAGFGRYRQDRFVHIDTNHYHRQRTWLQSKSS
jgi:uncharacterized protein YcbK (DUF882 family)